MRRIYGNRYQEIFFDQKVSLLKVIFSEFTESYSTTQLQKEALRFRDYVEEFKSDYLIIDVTHFRYRVSDDELSWVASLFPNRYAKKVAFVSSDEALHAKLAADAIVGMLGGLEGKVRFFEKESSAMVWIGEDYLNNRN